MKCIIYKLYFEEDDTYVYIGRTLHSVSKRVSAHKRAALEGKDFSPKALWVADGIRMGMTLCYEVLEEFDTSKKSISERETHWIMSFPNSLNCGVSNHKGIEVSENTKTKLKHSSKTSWNTKRKKRKIDFEEFFGLVYGGASNSEIARIYGVSTSYVSHIIEGRYRKEETKELRKKLKN